MINKELDCGTILYSEEAIANIVGKNTMEVAGVVGMAIRTPKEGLISILKKENLKQGVSVSAVDGKLQINISVIVLYGVVIAEICRNIMERIKYDIETYTGLEVGSVSVNVVGVQESKNN